MAHSSPPPPNSNPAFAPPPQQYYAPPPGQQYQSGPQYAPPPAGNAQFQQPYYPPGQAPPGQQQPANQGGYRGNHPCAAFFHVFFKFIAVLVYLLGTLLGGSFIGVFISVVLLLAVDFWITKNISGRLMVRLRWWNQITEDGQSEWVFESHPDASAVNGFDSYFFWTTTYGIVLVWAGMLVMTLLSPTNVPLTALGTLLNAANALGYTKCRKDSKAKLAQFAMRNPGLVAAAASHA
jgi:hypothetical protein